MGLGVARARAAGWPGRMKFKMQIGLNRYSAIMESGRSRGVAIKKSGTPVRVGLSKVR